jgi:acetyl-CoA carboxylase carboxyl transferase subunit alpha
MAYDLEFERPLAELEKKIAELERKIEAAQRRAEKGKANELAAMTADLAALKEDLERQTHRIYAGLSPWERVQVARHKQRPYTRDYIKLMCDEFFELRGDRHYGDDRAIQGGVACVNGRAMIILGHQKGRDTRERMECNFGMAHPEGYRKALRLMRHAERFHMPVVTLIDIAGAAIDLEAEERGISVAIAENLIGMAQLRTPILCIVTGEGGSGGALGISVGDRILMLEHAIYTVAAPEAAASILWRDAAFAPNAAETMKITAHDLLERGLIEGIIPEPLGGAHRDHPAMAATLKETIKQHLDELCALPISDLLEARYRRYRNIGATESLQAAPTRIS